MDESMNWNEDTSVRWKGGRKPSDSRIRIVLHLKVPVSIVIGVSVVAFVGMTMASLLLLFNILKQEHKIIKMSSPRLNNLILTGCIIVYLSVILFGLDGMVSSHQLAVLCQCRLWILSLGFSISFGSIFSKTWRVHVLLTNKKIQRKIIKDSQLFALVGIILGMDLILLTTWISVDPLKLKMLKFLPEMDEYDDTVTYPEVHICKSESLYWMPSLYGLKGLLLLFGVFLAWETRNVQIPALNDSRNIGLCVYNVFTMSAVGVIISMLIPRDSVVALYLVPCICIILSTTGTLLIIFLPKVIDVLKGHHIGRVSVMPTTNATSGSLDIGTASVPRCMGTCPEGMKLRELLREKQKEVGEKKGHI